MHIQDNNSILNKFDKARFFSIVLPLTFLLCSSIVALHSSSEENNQNASTNSTSTDDSADVQELDYFVGQWSGEYVGGPSQDSSWGSNLIVYANGTYREEWTDGSTWFEGQVSSSGEAIFRPSRSNAGAIDQNSSSIKVFRVCNTETNSFEANFGENVIMFKKIKYCSSLECVREGKTIDRAECEGSGLPFVNCTKDFTDKCIDNLQGEYVTAVTTKE